jgi:hypothetical protein
VTSARQIASNYELGRIKDVVKSPSVAEDAGSATVRSSGLIQARGAGASPRSSNFPSHTAQAVRFCRRLFEAEPTTVLQHMIASSDEVQNPSENLLGRSDDQVRLQVAKFLDDRPDFNIRTQSVLCLAAHRKAPGGSSTGQLDAKTEQQVSESLKLLQRVQALVPAPEAIKPLISLSMTSPLRFFRA